MNSKQAKHACMTGTLVTATAGAIMGGYLSWQAPMWKTMLAELSGCALGLVMGFVAWTVFACWYNAGWANGYSAGVEAAKDVIVAQAPADPPANNPTDTTGGTGPTATTGTA